MSNKFIREKLEKDYGKKCMLHEGLKIAGYKKSKCKYKGKSIASQLTVHHITPLRDGGPTTERNTALVCRGCHDYIEQTTEANRANINKALQQYKIVVSAFNSKGIQVQELDTNIIDYITIPLEENRETTKHRRAREKRELRKEIEEYDRL